MRILPTLTLTPNATDVDVVAGQPYNITHLYWSDMQKAYVRIEGMEAIYPAEIFDIPEEYISAAKQEWRDGIPRSIRGTF
jgi:hypothetical protein